MKQLLFFYFFSSLGNILFHLITSYFYSDIQELKFGFPIAMFFVLLFYSPLCTIFAYIYKIYKINTQIMKHPLLYSLFPFILTYIIKYVSDISIVFRDKMIIIIFVSENIFIIIWFIYQYCKKKVKYKNQQ